jgi:hypothetical protein
MKPMNGGLIVNAIAIKYRNLGYFRAPIPKVGNTNTRSVFEQLAKEKAEHLAKCALREEGVHLRFNHWY